MNSIERVMATVTGSEFDRQPFTMLLSLFGASLINAKTDTYYRNPKLWFKGQKAVVDIFDPDIIITPFSFPIEAEAFGSEMVFLNKYAPNIKKPLITDLSQIKEMQLPDLETSPSIQFLLQSTKYMCTTYKGTKAIGSPIHSPSDLPALLMGVEMWIDTLLFHPEEAELILEKTIEQFVNLGNQFLAEGTTFLIVPVNFTNPSIITQKIFLKVLPYLEQAFSKINGPIVIHNGGCILQPFLQYYSKLPNVIAIVLDPREKFTEARKIVGDDLVLMGNLDGPGLEKLTPDQVREKCVKILNDRKDDKRFIFSTSNADIPYNTSIENIKMISHTIKNFSEN